MTQTFTPLPPSLAARLWYATPILGGLTRAAEKDIGILWHVLIIFLTGVVLAFNTWGLVALTMTALAAVPLMFAFLILTTLP